MIYYATDDSDAPNFDTPDAIYKLQTSLYVVVACLTLCVWDWLLVVSDEIIMIRHCQRRIGYLIHGVYLITRICPIFSFVFTILLAESRSINTCRVLVQFIGVTNLVIMPTISGLFFIRASAVFSRNKYIIGIFGSCWLGVLGIFIFDSATILRRISTSGPSMQCFVVKHTDAWGYIGTAAYDTLMYFAISWRLASFTMTDGWNSRAKSFVTGSGLGGLSKALLRNGQVYYFLTIGFSICVVVFIYSPSISPEWNSLFLDPNITITSIMACRLFRELKLGQLEDPIAELKITKIVFRDMGSLPQQEHGDGSESRTLNNAGDIGTEGKPVTWDIENAPKDVVLEHRGPRVFE